MIPLHNAKHKELEKFFKKKCIMLYRFFKKVDRIRRTAIMI